MRNKNSKTKTNPPQAAASPIGRLDTSAGQYAPFFPAMPYAGWSSLKGPQAKQNAECRESAARQGRIGWGGGAQRW